MSTKCLVTTLDVVVDNENLPIFGSVVLPISNKNNLRLTSLNLLSSSSNIVLGFEDMQYYGSDNIITEKNNLFSLLPSGISITGDNPSVLIHKFGKFDTFTAINFDIDFEMLKSMKLPKGISIGKENELSKITGNIEDLFEVIKNSNPDQGGVDIILHNAIKAGVEQYTGDLTNLGQDFKIKQLKLYDAQLVTGSLDKVGLTADTLTYFGCAYTQEVTLTIENFVANARSIGVTEKSGFTIYWTNAINTMFNGNKVSAQNSNISWTANTITCNGTTIEA